MPSPEQLREEREKSGRALPGILDALAARTEAAQIAKTVAATHDVSEVTAYTWVTVIEERFLAARKRVAVLGNLLLGPGIALAVAGVLTAALSRRTVVGIILAAAGVAAAIAATVVLPNTRRIAGNLVRKRMSAE